MADIFSLSDRSRLDLLNMSHHCEMFGTIRCFPGSQLTGVYWVEYRGFWPYHSVPGGTTIIVNGDQINEFSIYVGRVYDDNKLVPAEIRLALNQAFISRNGSALKRKEFEVLCVEGYNCLWIPEDLGWSKDKAIRGGTTEDGKELFIAKGKAPNGSDVLGRVQDLGSAAIFEYQGKELLLESYSVLSIT